MPTALARPSVVLRDANEGWDRLIDVTKNDAGKDKPDKPDKPDNKPGTARCSWWLRTGSPKPATLARCHALAPEPWMQGDGALLGVHRQDHQGAALGEVFF